MWRIADPFGSVWTTVYDTTGEYPHNAVSLGLETIIDDRYSYFISYSTDVGHDYLFSMIYARSVVEPQPIDKYGIWPYEEEEAYPEFIVKELPDGTYERFTCDPSKLANYFGANPDAPHYLTPVYFKPSVLDRYRKNPLFDISERRLACGSKWSTEIDNVDPSRVMLFLGDLGRDVPSSERAHFLGDEMSPTGQSISTDTLESSIFGMWVTNPSVYICRIHPEAKRIRPSQGDRGIDLLIEHDDNSITVFQIKKFASNLTASQKGQIKDSWQALNNFVTENQKILREWHLVLPLDPTLEK